MAFDGLGSMPMQKIQDVRVLKQIAVDGEMKKRENREQLRRSLSVTRISNSKAAPVNGRILHITVGLKSQAIGKALHEVFGTDGCLKTSEEKTGLFLILIAI